MQFHMVAQSSLPISGGILDLNLKRGDSSLMKDRWAGDLRKRLFSDLFNPQAQKV
jgi:hypothetical protein